MKRMKTYVFEKGTIWCYGMNKRELDARVREYGKLIKII